MNESRFATLLLGERKGHDVYNHSYPCCKRQHRHRRQVRQLRNTDGEGVAGRHHHHHHQWRRDLAPTTRVKSALQSSLPPAMHSGVEPLGSNQEKPGYDWVLSSSNPEVLGVRLIARIRQTITTKHIHTGDNQNVLTVYTSSCRSRLEVRGDHRRLVEPTLKVKQVRCNRTTPPLNLRGQTRSRSLRGCLYLARCGPMANRHRNRPRNAVRQWT